MVMHKVNKLRTSRDDVIGQDQINNLRVYIQILEVLMHRN